MNTANPNPFAPAMPVNPVTPISDPVAQNPVQPVNANPTSPVVSEPSSTTVAADSPIAGYAIGGIDQSFNQSNPMPATLEDVPAQTAVVSQGASVMQTNDQLTQAAPVITEPGLPVGSEVSSAAMPVMPVSGAPVPASPNPVMPEVSSINTQAVPNSISQVIPASPVVADTTNLNQTPLGDNTQLPTLPVLNQTVQVALEDVPQTQSLPVLPVEQTIPVQPDTANMQVPSVAQTTLVTQPQQSIVGNINAIDSELSQVQEIPANPALLNPVVQQQSAQSQVAPVQAQPMQVAQPVEQNQPVQVMPQQPVGIVETPGPAFTSNGLPPVTDNFTHSKPQLLNSLSQNPAMDEQHPKIGRSLGTLLLALIVFLIGAGLFILGVILATGGSLPFLNQ